MAGGGRVTALLLFTLALIPFQVLTKVIIAISFLTFALVPDPVIRIGAMAVCAVVYWLNKLHQRFVIPALDAQEKAEIDGTEHQD